MGLIKLAVVVGTLFVVTIWTGAMEWVHSVNPWYFLIAFVIIVARPFYRDYLKWIKIWDCWVFRIF